MGEKKKKRRKSSIGANSEGENGDAVDESNPEQLSRVEETSTTTDGGVETKGSKRGKKKRRSSAASNGSGKSKQSSKSSAGESSTSEKSISPSLIAYLILVAHDAPQALSICGFKSTHMPQDGKKKRKSK